MSKIGDKLANKLISFSSTLNLAEQYNFHLMISAGIENVFPSRTSSELHDETWKACLKLLSYMSPNGLTYVGKTLFLDNIYLQRLKKEAKDLEQSSIRAGPSGYSPGGPVALELCSDPRLISHVSKILGTQVEPTKVSSYLYYNRLGDHIYPHIDTKIFSINCIVMIKHTLPNDGSRGSALVVYRPDGEAEHVWLNPGEMALLLASGTVHGREVIRDNEKVTILTIGLQVVI